MRPFRQTFLINAQRFYRPITWIPRQVTTRLLYSSTQKPQTITDGNTTYQEQLRTGVGHNDHEHRGADEKVGGEGNGNSNGHDSGQDNHGGGWWHNAYYPFMVTLTMATLVGTGLYTIIKGTAKKEAEDFLYEKNPPAIPGPVAFGVFTAHQQMTHSVTSALKQGFLSPKNKSNIKRLLLSGEGGIGKLPAAMLIAKALHENNKDKDHFYETTISIRAHDREGMEEDLIRAAIRLGAQRSGVDIKDVSRSHPEFQKYLTTAKQFISEEVIKRPGITFIFRCARDEKLLKELEDIIDPPSTLPKIPPVIASIIVTTGSEDFEKKVTKRTANKFDHISLNESFTTEDLDEHLSKNKVLEAQLNIGPANRKNLVNIFQKNPTVARIGLRYLELNPYTSLVRFKDEVEEVRNRRGVSREAAVTILSIEQIKKKFPPEERPLIEKVLVKIAPPGTTQSAGCFMEDLLEDKELQKGIPEKIKDKETYIRDILDELAKYELVSFNENKKKSTIRKEDAPAEDEEKGSASNALSKTSAEQEGKWFHKMPVRNTYLLRNEPEQQGSSLNISRW